MKSAFQEFNRIDGQIQRSYHEAAVKMGLPDSEFWILYVLATNEPEMLQTELTAITGVSKTTINSALKKMEPGGAAGADAGRRTQHLRAAHGDRTSAGGENGLPAGCSGKPNL